MRLDDKGVNWTQWDWRKKVLILDKIYCVMLWLKLSKLFNVSSLGFFSIKYISTSLSYVQIATGRTSNDSHNSSTAAGILCFILAFAV